MDGGIVSTLFGHHIVQKGRQISSRVPLEEEAESVGVAESVVVVKGYTVQRKVLINLLGGITLRSTFVLAPPYGVLNTADYGEWISSTASHFDT